MGLDTPTPTGSSSASSQQSQPPSGFDPFAGDGPSEPKKEEALGADDSFPEDLNGLEGIGPLANLTNTSGPGGTLMDAKVEPYFAFSSSAHPHNNPQQPSSANGLLSHAHQSQQHFCGPGSAPAGPCSADSGHSSSGAISGSDLRRPSSSQNRLVIRDPFAPDLPPLVQSPNGQEVQLQPMLAPLSWNGNPPQDAKSMAETARLSMDPGRPPMVPLPNVKERQGVAPGGMYPQWSFYNFNTPMQRQRLEQLYPPGSFPPAYFNHWGQMPVPMIRPMVPMAGRIIALPLRPGVQLPPGLIPPQLAERFPRGCFPAVLMPTPNGLVPMPIWSVSQAMMAPAGLPFPPPPGLQPPPAQQMPPATSSSSTGAGAKQGAPPKKKAAPRQKKQREKEEQTRREQQEQAQAQVAAIAAGAAMAVGRSPMDGQLQPPPFYGAPGQMPPPMGQPPQQEACFKVPGRSPPLKRCNSSRGSAPLSLPLTPMPEQRIHVQGQCCLCQSEIHQNHKAIQCTAISQGCNQLFHWDCAGLSLEAFAEFCRDTRLEWICQNCFHTRNKEQCLMFAC